MFGDIGIGILLSIFISAVFDVDLSSQLILLGIIFSLLPDIDMLGYLSPKLRRVFGKHREITHFPIIYIPLVILVWVLFGQMWAIFMLVGVFIHFLHDTIWMGPGIKWFWPKSEKLFKYFAQDRGIGNENWIKYFYLRPNVVSVSEYGVFILSLVILSNCI